MIYTIKITDQADNDIRNIYEYIAYELQSPENASGQLDRIEKCIMSLDDMSERYCFYDRESWKSRGLHIVPVVLGIRYILYKIGKLEDQRFIIMIKSVGFVLFALYFRTLKEHVAYILLFMIVIGNMVYQYYLLSLER